MPYNEPMKNKLVSLAEVGLKAIEVYAAENAVKAARNELESQYDTFKKCIGVDFVEEDSEQWGAMMDFTKPQHEALKRAKADLKNAKRRLVSAIKRG